MRIKVIVIEPENRPMTCHYIANDHILARKNDRMCWSTNFNDHAFSIIGDLDDVIKQSREYGLPIIFRRQFSWCPKFIEEEYEQALCCLTS